MGTLINQLVAALGSATAPGIKLGTGAVGFFRTGSWLASTVKGIRQNLTSTTGGSVNFRTLLALAGTNQTLTAAQLLGGLVNGTPTGAAAYTTDTAANIDAAIPGVQTGDSFEVVIVNTSGGANTITVTAGAGVTVRGNAAIAQNKAAKVVFVRTGAAAWDAWSLPCA